MSLHALGYINGIYFFIKMKGFPFALDSTRKYCEKRQGKGKYYSQNLGIMNTLIQLFSLHGKLYKIEQLF
jgi:hypothetical protein